MEPGTLKADVLDRHKKRAADVWSKRAGWNGIVDEAYEYGMPMRRAEAGQTPGSVLSPRVFDMTAPMATMFFAGNLQRDLFPSGQPPFTIETGPMAAAAIGAEGRKVLDRELETTAKIMFPFFQTGDWDTAIHETCIDLACGTGALIPIKGNLRQPIIFASIPFKQIAIACDAWGRPSLISWKQEFEQDAVLKAFEDGTFDPEFRKTAREKPYDMVTVWQDFVRDPQMNGWHFVAYMDKGPEIRRERYRSQPIAVPRYYRLNGQAYGFGPLLTALPSIKTVNKAQELALKSAAISMLGIWGYRSGGTFNPDTVRLAPGEFWPMQATGGILGPDVSRLDPAGARQDVAKMLIGNLQDQIRQAMFDTRLPEYSGTPKSSQEIFARMRQSADVHIGAFGRLVHELMPVLVPRCAEILYELGILQTPLPIDMLLVATKVRSPMAAALNAERLSSIAQYFEIVAAMAGLPRQVDLYAKRDTALDRIADGMQIDKDLIPTAQERAETERAIAAEQDAQLAMLAAQEAAKQAPGLAARAAESDLAAAA